MIKSKAPFYWLPAMSHPLCKQVISGHGMRAYGWVCFTLSNLQRSDQTLVSLYSLTKYGASVAEERALMGVTQQLLDEYWQF